MNYDPNSVMILLLSIIVINIACLGFYACRCKQVLEEIRDDLRNLEFEETEKP